MLVLSAAVPATHTQCHYSNIYTFSFPQNITFTPTPNPSQNTVHSSQFSVHSLQFTVHSSQFTVHISQFTVQTQTSSHTTALTALFCYPKKTSTHHTTSPLPTLFTQPHCPSTTLALTALHFQRIRAHLKVCAYSKATTTCQPMIKHTQTTPPTSLKHKENTCAAASQTICAHLAQRKSRVHGPAMQIICKNYINMLASKKVATVPIDVITPQWVADWTAERRC